MRGEGGGGRERGREGVRVGGGRERGREGVRERGESMQIQTVLAESLTVVSVLKGTLWSPTSPPSSSHCTVY